MLDRRKGWSAVGIGIALLLLAPPLGGLCSDFYLLASGGMESGYYLLCSERFMGSFQILGGLCAGLGGIGLLRDGLWETK